MSSQGWAAALTGFNQALQSGREKQMQLAKAAEERALAQAKMQFEKEKADRDYELNKAKHEWEKNKGFIEIPEGGMYKPEYESPMFTADFAGKDAPQPKAPGLASLFQAPEAAAGLSTFALGSKPQGLQELLTPAPQPERQVDTTGPGSFANPKVSKPLTEDQKRMNELFPGGRVDERMVDTIKDLNKPKTSDPLAMMMAREQLALGREMRGRQFQQEQKDYDRGVKQAEAIDKSIKELDPLGISLKKIHAKTGFLSGLSNTKGKLPGQLARIVADTPGVGPIVLSAISPKDKVELFQEATGVLANLRQQKYGASLTGTEKAQSDLENGLKNGDTDRVFQALSAIAIAYDNAFDRMRAKAPLGSKMYDEYGTPLDDYKVGASGMGRMAPGGNQSDLIEAAKAEKLRRQQMRGSPSGGGMGVR